MVRNVLTVDQSSKTPFHSIIGEPPLLSKSIIKFCTLVAIKCSSDAEDISLAFGTSVSIFIGLSVESIHIEVFPAISVTITLNIYACLFTQVKVYVDVSVSPLIALFTYHGILDHVDALPRFGNVGVAELSNTSEIWRV